MLSYLQRYIPAFENYLKAENPTQYLQTLTDPNERKLLETLTQKITNIKDYKHKMDQLRLDATTQRRLIITKIINYLKTATEIKDDDIGNQIKSLFSNNRFEYSKPPTLTAAKTGEENEDKTPNSLHLQPSLVAFLENKITKKPDTIRSLNDYALSKLSHKTLLALPLFEKEYLLDKCGILYHFQPEFTSQFLLAYQTQKKKISSTYKLNSKVLSSFTRKQIDHLGKAAPTIFDNQDYIELWFNLHYSERINKFVEGSAYFSKIEQEKKRQALLQIIKDLQHHKHTIIKSYINKLKSEVVFLDLIVADTDIKRIIEHLQISVSTARLSQLNAEFRKQREKRLSTNDSSKFSAKMRYALQIDSQQPDKFVEDYLFKLFKNNKENLKYIDQLSQYLNRKYLVKLNMKALLARGQTSQNLHEYFDVDELQALRVQKQIKLHSTNKRKYRQNDEVQIDVSVKNVHKIDVKIYQINLQKQSLIGLGQITDDVNLSFLKAAQQYTLELDNENPFTVHDTVILLNSERIPKRMGVYIVDLQGDTITSRVVIRKGTILCLESFTEAGQQFSFYDQEGRPLTAKDGLKVWARNTPVALRDDSNYFFINYGEKAEWVSIVASIGSFAQKFQKQIKPQAYKFDVGYIYNSESFIVGTKAKIILHGRLSMNERNMSLQLLKNIKVKVTVTNDKGIATYYSFNINRWLDREDQTIEFPVQSYISSVSIAIEAQIILQSKKETTVNHNKIIKIYLRDDNTNFVDFYLQKNRKEQYELNLLGLNGEPIPNTEVILNYSIRGVSEVQKTIVKTDAKGIVHLGRLQIVNTLNAQINSQDLKLVRVWKLDRSQSSFNYTNTIYIKIGQQIHIPVQQSWNIHDLVLLRTFDKYHAEDITDKLTLKKGRLTLPTINEEGYYVLKLLPLDKTIEIITLKNFKWEGDTEQNQKVYDENQNKIYEISKNLFQNIAIQQLTLEPQQNNLKANISLALQDLTPEQRKKVRVHVSASNFISHEVADTFRPQNYNTQPKLVEQYLRQKDTAYYSNKTLSDEGAYVWKRQKQTKNVIGNNLEKPGIFLKRTLVRQTQQENENLRDEDEYLEECAMMDVDPNMRERLKQRKADISQSSLSASITPVLNSHNNFLLQSGFVQSNLNGDTISVTVPQNYNQLQVLILTPSSAIKRTFSLGGTDKKQFKDLRHAGMKQTAQNKGWTMSRQVYQLGVGEEKIVSRNSQWRTVTLSDIFEFANAKRYTLFSWSSHLLNWPSYSEQKKREIYDKECCHELNTFIRFQDPEFFNRIVKKYITNKINKTFVDYCLLSDPHVKEYATIDQYSKLNAFEKALLVFSLIELKDVKTAQNIAATLEMEQDSKKKDYQTFKNNFDTIINAKADQSQAPKSKLMENKERLQQMKGKRMLRQASPAAAPQLFTKCAAMKSEECEEQSYQNSAMSRRSNMMREQRKAFVPIESTKQYSERTYYTVKNYKKQAPRLLNPTPFWAKLASHFLSGKSTNILAKEFMNFNSQIDFILAAAFISSESSSNFDIVVQGESYRITARSPMLLYVKEVKELDFCNKYGIQINQRFIDPQNKYYYEDGLQIEKEVEQFIVKKPYILQTVVTNTSGTPLELQILIDIPKGTIPLMGQEYTQISNTVVSEYSSKEYQRFFYAPTEGEYPIYPSNACRGSTIIARAQPKPELLVKSFLTKNKLQSFEDILRSGNKNEIIKFISTKNIFDNKLFQPASILWMLKDKPFYLEVIALLREKRFFDNEIWNFAILHKDIQAIRELAHSTYTASEQLEPAVFEYFPYYSTRTHQFANETKSTIRNVQFKNSYLDFLLASVISVQSPSSFSVAFAYYLILQDRLLEAKTILDKLSKQHPQQHQIQVDYMLCFLDMSLDKLNCSTARQILTKYKDYPIQSWAKLFNDVRNTLEAEDEDFPDIDEKKRTEEFQTQIIQQIGQFKIIQPADTTIRVQFYEINLELLFSEYPFDDYTAFTHVQPSLFKEYAPNHQTSQIIIRRSDYPLIRNATIQITETRQGLPPKKVSTFDWTNSEVKVKVSENAGLLQVFVNKKKQAGAYVKVFSKSSYSPQFYRDGYTDMTGTFRYAMSDLDGIAEFAILVMTERGGVTQRVKPPSKLASY